MKASTQNSAAEWAMVFFLASAAGCAAPEQNQQSAANVSGNGVTAATPATSTTASTAATVSVERETPEYEDFVRLMDDYWAAWSAPNGLQGKSFDDAERFYAKDANLIFYDPLPPLEGHAGWGAIRTGVEKVWRAAGARSWTIRRTPEPRIRRRGDVAWATAPHEARVTLANGQTQTAEQRQTFVWERRAGRWQIVHEHASRIVPLGSQLAKRELADTAVSVAPTDAEFNQTVRDFWAAWSTKDSTAVSRFYGQDANTTIFLPWVNQQFVGWQQFQPQADRVLAGLDRAEFTPYDDTRTWRWNDLVLTVGTFGINLAGKDGKRTTGDARYTLLWERRDGRWQIVHEHLSSVAAA